MTMTDLLPSVTARSTKGRVPVFRPLLKGEEFPVKFTSAKIVCAVGAHEAATLSCTSTELTTTDGLTNKPISFLYGQAPRTETFCGYIVDVGETRAGQGSISFDLQVLGVTQPMQVGQPRFWTNRTIPSAVEATAFSSKLGFDGHTHPFVWRSLAQTSESDWTYVTQLVDRIGWGIFNRYGVVMCYDPLKLFQDQGVYASLVSSQDQDFDPTADRRLIEFNPTEASDLIPQTLGHKLAYFTDAGQVQVLKEIGDFQKYVFVSNRVIRNAEEAELYADSSSETDKWKQMALARMWGDADIYPGMCIDVVTTNARYLRQKFDGRWLVTGTTHSMDAQQYQTMLLLRRPGSSTVVTQNPYQGFWTTAKRPRPTLSIINDEWVSSWTNSYAGSVL